MPSSYLIDAQRQRRRGRAGLPRRGTTATRGAHPRAARRDDRWRHARCALALLAIVLLAVAAPAARRSTPPKPWEKGDLARADDAVRRRPARGEDARSTSTRARKARPAATASAAAAVAATRRKRDARGALQPSRRRSRATRASLLAAALALPGVLPATALAQAAPDQGIFALRYLDYRDWQPGADRMRCRARRCTCCVPFSDTLAVEGTLVYDAMSGASPLYLQHAVRRVGLGVTDYRTAGDVKVTQVFRPLGDRRRRRVLARARLHVARGLARRALVDDGPQPTCAFGFGGTHDRINPTNGVARQRAARHARFPGRHHAGADRRRDRAVEHHVLDRPRLLLRSVQAARHAARPPAHLRVAHALQPVRSPAHDATLRSRTGCCTIRSASDSNMIEAAWVQALPAGLHA